MPRCFTAMAVLVLGMLPSLKKKTTLGQSNAWGALCSLRLHHACMKHVVDSINKFCSNDSHIMCADCKVVFLLYPYELIFFASKFQLFATEFQVFATPPSIFATHPCFFASALCSLKADNLM